MRSAPQLAEDLLHLIGSAKDLTAALQAAGAAIKARDREVARDCAQAMCEHCRRGLPPLSIGDNVMHDLTMDGLADASIVDCDAAPIYARFGIDEEIAS